MIQDQEITTEYLTGLLEWSQPQVIKRAGGFKHRYIAEPNQDLEWLWHHRRAELIAIGIDRAPVTDGTRLVIWWQDAPVARDHAAELIKASSAVDADISVSVPAGLSLRGYQKACVAFARGKRALLIADQAGIGKTPESIAIINDHPEWKTGLIICKNIGKINWLRELRRWLTRPMSMWIADTSIFPHRDIVIINYQLLTKYKSHICARNWDFIIADEAHMFKSSKAQVFKNMMELQRTSGNRFALTGTPIVNVAEDIFQILTWLDPITYDNSVRFKYLYNEPRRLHNHLRTHIMLRRLKKDVLQELPKVEHRIVEFDDEEPMDGPARELYSKLTEIEKAIAEAQIHKDERAFRLALSAMDDALKVPFSEMSEFRKRTGERKFEYCMEFLKSAMEETDKIVVFAHHRHLLEKAHSEIPGSVLLYGGMHNNDKQLAIDRFQNDPKVPVFFASITTAGDTITLTASSRVIFFEQDWRPAIMEQCISRVDRMGQVNSVLVDHLTLRNSCDSKVARRLTMKMELSENILDRK